MLSHIPVWVAAVLVALLALGYRQSLPRTVQPTSMLAVALALLGFSLFGLVSSFGSSAVALVIWALAYAASAVLGCRWVATHRMVRQGRRVHLSGSWAPMALLLGIFAAKFVLGWAAGMHSPVLREAWFIAGMSGLLGALSGGFGARALAVYRHAATGMAAPVAPVAV